ncbi:hypothetical protein [Halococcus agarilyticus]|uniref:hypothetical protein n=1 Tax=Halococcus agarilyticus TaxID=1232219 RepID=UPI0012AC4B34|nr:hypothetical protein [Halococcus agarilyticus]
MSDSTARQLQSSVKNDKAELAKAKAHISGRDMDAAELSEESEASLEESVKFAIAKQVREE